MSKRIRLKEKEFNIPDVISLLKGSKNESLIYFGTTEKEKRYSLCLGVGRVVRITHGENLDIVKINFGRHYARKIIAKDNHARKMIHTLTKGQLAWFYGFVATYPSDENEHGFETIFYAKGFQGWYVPKIFDIRKDPIAFDEEIEKEEEINMLTFLDDILNKENEE